MPDLRPALDYAPPPSLLRRRVFRLGVAVFLLTCGILAAVAWGPAGWRRARVAYWQRQCLHYTAPADQVVYDQDPATASALARRGAGYSAVPAAKSAITVYEPPCLAALESAAPSVPTTGPGAVLFLHERRTPAGIRRLVVIRSSDFATVPKPLFISGFDVEAYVLEPGTWGASPTDRTPVMAIDVMSSLVSGTPKLRVFAGQPDPADPTHFTIRYELEGKSHTVDGWLREYGVDFKTREPDRSDE